MHQGKEIGFQFQSFHLVKKKHFMVLLLFETLMAKLQEVFCNSLPPGFYYVYLAYLFQLQKP